MVDAMSTPSLDFVLSEVASIVDTNDVDVFGRQFAVGWLLVTYEPSVVTAGLPSICIRASKVLQGARRWVVTEEHDGVMIGTVELDSARDVFACAPIQYEASCMMFSLCGGIDPREMERVFDYEDPVFCHIGKAEITSMAIVSRRVEVDGYTAMGVASGLLEGEAGGVCDVRFLQGVASRPDRRRRDVCATYTVYLAVQLLQGLVLAPVPEGR